MNETGADFGRRRRIRRWIGGSLLVVGAVSAGLWLERRPIARHFVDTQLHQRGVPARYTLAVLDPFHQRLTNIVIGDPAHPDLVADRIDLTTQWSLTGAQVMAVRVGRVRIAARYADGRLRLGAIDRLLPPPAQGRPFRLPALWVEVADARVRLVTPAGVVGAHIAGKGRLDDGFAGRVAMISERLAGAGCAAEHIAGVVSVRIAAARPMLKGPVRAGTVDCAGVTAHGASAAVDAVLGDRLDRWSGGARIAAADVRHPRASLTEVHGQVRFEGGPAQTKGDADLAARTLAFAGTAARAVALAGPYDYGAGGLRFDARASAGEVAIGAGDRNAWRGLARLTAGSPVAPIAERAAAAADRAARGFALGARVALEPQAGGYRLTIADARLSSISGARARVSGKGITIAFSQGSAAMPEWTVDALATLAGGGLPEAVARLQRARAGGALRGGGFVRPYAAGSARLALGDLHFTSGAGGVTRITTAAELSGPLGDDGSVTRARLPIALQWHASGGLRVDRRCVPLAFDALRYGALTLDPARVQLCPAVEVRGGRLRGDLRAGPVRLAGRLGDAALRLEAANARVDLAKLGFDLAMVDTALGSGESVTRLHLTDIDGQYARGALAGRFRDGGGKIGQVPVLMSGAGGSWRFADGALAVNGDLTVADSDSAPRFNPLAARDVALRLADSRIAVTGRLDAPESGAKVSDVTIAHDLGSGAGHAVLAVPGIAFTEKLQPDALTRFTKGLIADVRGQVHGEGRIDWTHDGVTSHGRFASDGLDFAAALGPVYGVSGAIDFTDLLGLVSAPGQQLKVARINPGVSVTDGQIRYQLLADQKLRVEGGRWPFAGGMLILEPALLDLSESARRRFTLRVEGVDAARFLQEFDFRNLSATGTFDGTLPLVFDAKGGRIEKGELTVREGGGELAYVGEVSQKDLGFWGNTAFQALRALRYRRLTIEMNGPLDGEVVTDVRFSGLSQGKGAKSNFLVRRLQKLPFVFNVRIAAPFRQLIDSAQSLYDPRKQVERNLQALIDAQNAAVKDGVQPSASEAVPKGEPK